ncbi:MAG: YdcH family protein [Pseudorhodoplanes sp.]
MSMQEHLVDLEARHRALEEEIADALAHPSIDDTKIVELKRRKLRVKDEIARMQTSIH